MHELSIAESLVECVAEEAARRNIGRITAVHMRLGALSGVVKDALLFSFDVAAQGTVADGARLLIEEIPVVVDCATCRVERTLDTAWELRCPVCGTVAPTIVHGRELELVAVEVPDDDPHR